MFCELTGFDEVHSVNADFWAVQVKRLEDKRIARELEDVKNTPVVSNPVVSDSVPQMFKKDQPVIQNAVWANQVTMYRTLLFVRLSIRRKLERVYPLIDRVIKTGIAPGISAVEYKSISELSALSVRLFNNYNADSPPMDILRECVKTFGIGIVKAGFIVQLLTGKVGCLDSHNLKLYGITESFRTDCAWAKVETKMTMYIALCKELGGSEFLWNGWCQHVSNLRPSVWPSAESVSVYHVNAILGV